jgi:hypothetical protein
LLDLRQYLGNMGQAYASLGDARKAIEYYDQALVQFDKGLTISSIQGLGGIG